MPKQKKRTHWYSNPSLTFSVLNAENAAEAITLCLRMFLGDRLFCLDSGELTFAIEPALPDWLFREDGTLSFRYLGCRFIYINRSTWRLPLSSRRRMARKRSSPPARRSLA